ncbi:MAG: hypothetical protein ACJA08_000025 [Cyclobacteriaceae bacterium]|jgi:hypothetical protein
MKAFGIACISFLYAAVGLAQGFTEIGESLGINYDFKTDDYGGGVSFADFNQDGLDDLTFTSGPGEHVRFHLNNGNGFTELSPLVNDTTETKQVLWIDYDNDGLLDLFLTSVNENKLYRQTTYLQFEDATTAMGIESLDQLTFTAHWIDYNRDGWVDLFVTYRTKENEGFIQLYKNNQGNSFDDLTIRAGLKGKGNSVLTMTSFDYNNDGWSDIFLAQDWEQGNQLLRNNGNGTFTDVSIISNTNQKMNSMTATVTDYNEDGWFDIYVTNTREGTAFLRNNQDGTFTDVAEEMGLFVRSLTFGAIFFDADNDTDLDLHIVGGQVNYMFENPGNGLPFRRVNNGWGFQSDGFFNNGFATGDYNGDGYLDLVKNSMTLTGTGAGMNTFWENNFSSNNYLMVDLEGTISNKSGIGAIITVYFSGRIFKRRVACGESFCSQLSYRQFFGLGENEIVEKVIVDWPSGNITEITDVAANQILHIVETTQGCTDPTSCNYNPLATADNGTCRLATTYYDCDGCKNDKDQDGVCDELEIEGCTDLRSCTFDPHATEDDGSCWYPPTYEITGETNKSPKEPHTYSYPSNTGSKYFWEATNGSVIIGQGTSSVLVIWDEFPWILIVTETDANNCVSDPVKLEISSFILSTEKDQSYTINIHPNPASTHIWVSSNQSFNEHTRIYITNIQGRKLIETHPSEIGNTDIDITMLKNGIYVITVGSEDQLYQSKIIIQRSP